MKRLGIALLLLCASLLVTTPGWAAPPKQGGLEGSVLMGGTLLSGDLDDLFSLAAMMGIQYTDNIAVGVRAEFGFGNDKVYDAVLEGRYYFLVDELAVPYAGVLAGPAWVRSNGDSDPALKIGGFGGLKYYMTPIVSVFLEAQMGVLMGEENANYGGLMIGASAKF